MKILDKLSKPPKHKHIFNPTEEEIEKLSKQFEEELEIPPELEAHMQREIDLGLHPGPR